MNTIKYVWQVIQWILLIGLIFFIFNQLYGAFEIISVSILILIYVAVKFGFSSTSYTMATNTLVLYYQFRSIKELLSPSLNKDHLEDLNNQASFSDSFFEIQEKMKKAFNKEGELTEEEKDANKTIVVRRNLLIIDEIMSVIVIIIALFFILSAV